MPAVAVIAIMSAVPFVAITNVPAVAVVGITSVPAVAANTSVPVVAVVSPVRYFHMNLK